MELIETSAWIEFLRNTGSPTCERVDALVRSERFNWCDPVRMELLAGAHGDGQRRSLDGLLFRGRAVSTDWGDWYEAASLYRQCRAQGETVRKMIDCVIAAIAIRKGVPVLHADRDFAVLARHTDLQVVPASRHPR